MKQYEEFKSEDALSYGAQASSANINKAPLLIKKELNSLYNYTKVKTGGKPLAWSGEELYIIGDYVTHNDIIYVAAQNSVDIYPGEQAGYWDVVVINDAEDTTGYTKFEIDSLLANKYDADNVPPNPKFTDTIYDDTNIQNQLNDKVDINSDRTLHSGTAMSISGQTLTLQKGDGSLDFVSIPVAEGINSNQLLDDTAPLSITPYNDGYQTLTLKTGSGGVYSIDIEGADLQWVLDGLAEKAPQATTYTKTEVDNLITTPVFNGIEAIGTYAFLGLSVAGGSIVAGNTYLGNLLKYAGSIAYSGGGEDGTTPVSIWGDSPTGTWTAVGTVTAVAGYYPMTMFVRIS